MSRFTSRAGRVIATASLLGGLTTTLLVSEGRAQQPAEQAAKPTSVTPEEAARATLRSETRIRRLHDKLEITSNEESLWGPVEQVMRDNEAAFRSNLMDKTTDMKLATAVNDLKIFQIIADHHSSGLKKFIPVFEKLYESMTPDQQKRADRVFGENSRSLRM